MKKVILSILFLSLISGIAFSEVTRKITQKGYTKEAIYYSGNKEIAKEIFDEKGNIKRVGKIPNGIVKQYYESGKLEAEVNFKNGKKEGITKQYYENGKIWAEWNYKDDKLEGILKGYDDESGELRSEINLKDGKREGIIKTYYENGKLEAEGNYRDDKLEGIERRYNKNGEILAIDTYKKGIKINSKKYDTLGKEIMNQDYPYEPVFTVENMEQGLSDTLTTAFFKTKKFTVLERPKVKELLKEQVFQLTGSTTNEDAVKIGKMLNAKFVVISSIAKISKEFVINIKIVDVETSELVSAETEKCYAEKDLIGSIQKLVQIVSDKTIEKYPKEEVIPIAVLDLEIK